MTEYHVPLATKCLVVGLTFVGFSWLAGHSLGHKPVEHAYSREEVSQMTRLIENGGRLPETVAKPVVISPRPVQAAPLVEGRVAVRMKNGRTRELTREEAEKRKMKPSEAGQAVFDLFECRGECSKQEFAQWASKL